MSILNRIFGKDSKKDSKQGNPKITLSDGAAIILGPDKERRIYAKEIKESLSAEARQIGELNIEDNEINNLVVIIIQYIPWLKGKAACQADLEKWSAALLDKVTFMPEDSDVVLDMSANQQNNVIVFALRWKRTNTQSFTRLIKSFESGFIALGGSFS